MTMTIPGPGPGPGPLRRVLTVAGSDSGGGAGIQADLKTFTVMDCYGMAAMTALTAQNTLGVHGIHPVPPDFVRRQIDVIASDLGVDALKTGMLATAEMARAVAAAISDWGWTRLVVDPVMVSKSGHHLLEAGAREAVRTSLLPLALIVTPNVHEAEVLAGMRVGDTRSALAAARTIHSMGPRYVVLKGGHLEGDQSSDLVLSDDGCSVLAVPRIETRNTHGTGCTFSAAIAAALAHGLAPLEAIAAAKGFISKAIALAANRRLGGGHGPVDHCGAAGLSWRPEPVPYRPCQVD